MPNSLKVQCKEIYKQQAEIIASANRVDLENVGAIGGAFIAPLVIMKTVPSAIILAGFAAVGYGGWLVGKSLAGHYHSHCSKIVDKKPFIIEEDTNEGACANA